VRNYDYLFNCKVVEKLLESTIASIRDKDEELCIPAMEIFIEITKSDKLSKDRAIFNKKPIPELRI